MNEQLGSDHEIQALEHRSSHLTWSLPAMSKGETDKVMPHYRLLPIPLAAAFRDVRDYNLGQSTGFSG